MKIKIILLLLLLFSFCLLRAQNPDQQKKIRTDKQFKGEIIAGMNLSQVDGDEVYGFNKMGLHVGAGAMIPLWHRFSFSVEVLFDQRGSFRKYAPGGDTLPPPYYSLKLNYLSAPFLIHFEDRDTWTFGVGFSYGRLVSFSETEHGTKQPWTYSTFPYNKNDFNILADIRFRVWKHLKFNLRYSYSLAKIRTRDYSDFQGNTWTRKQYNNVITLRLVYMLNEKYLPDRNKIEKRKKKKEKKQ